MGMSDLTASGWSDSTTMSTRRFFANSAALLPSAIGLAAPYPTEAMRPAGIPPDSTRRRSTWVERPDASSQLVANGYTAWRWSACPSTLTWYALEIRTGATESSTLMATPDRLMLLLSKNVSDPTSRTVRPRSLSSYSTVW